MLITETKFEKDGAEYILIEFRHHKAVIYSAEIPAKYERCSALRLAKAKQNVIGEFLKSPSGQGFCEKEVLKAYSKTDEYFAGVYREKYPHGGWRQGGRPKGSRTSNRTERLQQTITPEEKAFLLRALEYYRTSPILNIDDIFPTPKAGNRVIHKEPMLVKEQKQKVSDEYINAVKQIQNKQPRRKLRTLDEAYREYQEQHKA